MTAAGAQRASARVSRPAEDETLARFFHGLSDPTRVRILRFLLDGPKSTGEIVRHLGRHQPSVSSHLTCLRFCGFIEARRQGRYVLYEIIDPDVRRIMEKGERYLERNEERILACRVIGVDAE